MLKRTYKLAAAVAAAGTICALGAASMAGATTTGWGGRLGPVPGADTNATPAITAATFGSSPVNQTVVAWKGDGNAHIFYSATTALGVKKDYSAKAAIPGAASTAAPSLATYTDPNGREAIVAVWRGAGGLISYAQGETEAGQKIVWTAVNTLPNSVYNTTDAAPSVTFLLDRYAAVIAFRGPHDHIRYIEGLPAGRNFRWSSSYEVSPTAVADSGPAITEQQTGTAHGSVSIFWRDAKTHEVATASTPDPVALPGKVVWTYSLVAGSATSDNPAAATLGLHGSGSLLLAYKALHGTHVLYQVLTSTGWTAPAPVPSTSTVYGPALFRGELATTSSSSAGNIYFHVFS
jgi:hypothetical protein